jgi:mannuronan 5-epimerase
LKQYNIIVSLFTLVLFILVQGFLFFFTLSYSTAEPQQAQDSCITYNKSHRIISINCGSTNLTDIYNSLKNPHRILDKEKKTSSKVWLLNANIEVKDGATLYINSTDTSWLKINSMSTKGSAYSILAHGSLIIDSTKITSWDIKKNDYGKTNSDGTLPRSYILVKYGSSRGEMTNITNSEMAYLGYDYPNSFGLTYYTGAGSIIRNNKIHDLWYGFYSHSEGAYNIRIENNEFYNNHVYGIDPHSGTHDMTISNNTVHDNGRHGIICSTDCYNIIIDSNKVFGNTKDGIMLYANVSRSIIKNNIVYDNQGDQIVLLNFSHNNKVYANNMTGGKSGVVVSEKSSNNMIVGNSIRNSSQYGIYLLEGAFNNLFSSNLILYAKVNAINLSDPTTYNNTFKDNLLLTKNNNNKNAIAADSNGNNKFFNTKLLNTAIITLQDENRKNDYL